MMRRRRSKPATSQKDRLATFAKEVRDEAFRLQPGRERDALLKEARQADTSAHIEDWANSRGLKPPD
jgi:hypothetical protein